MNQPVVPPGFQAPPPPAPPAAGAPAAAPPPQPQVSIEDQLRQQIPAKCVFNGQQLATPEQQQWAFDALTTHFQTADAALNFVNGAQNIDLATIRQPQNTTPPDNPVSDDQSAAKDQPDPAPAKKEAPNGEFVCQECQKVCSSLRGLKTHIKKSHSCEWEDYCAKYSLNAKTGEPAGGGSAQTVGPVTPPTTEAPASRVPTQTTPTGQVQATPPVPPADTTHASAPADVTIPTENFIGEAQANEVYYPYIFSLIPDTCVFATGEAIGQDKVQLVTAHLEQEFLAKCSGTQARTTGFQVYCWLTQLKETGQRYIVSLAPAEPQQQTLSLAPAEPQQPQPQPQPQQQQQQTLSLAPQGVPTFQPGAAPVPAAAPAAPAAAAAPAAPAAAAAAAPIPAAEHPDPMVQQAANIVASTMGQPTAPEQVQSAAPQPAPVQTTSNRAEFARTLGGEVDLVIVTLSKVTNDITRDRVDANQLAGLAEVQALQQITDPDDLKYRRDKQIAAGIFAKLLTANPKVYVLMSGYEWVLPDHLLKPLMQRVTAGALITNNDTTQFNW